MSTKSEESPTRPPRSQAVVYCAQGQGNMRKAEGDRMQTAWPTLQEANGAPKDTFNPAPQPAKVAESPKTGTPPKYWPGMAKLKAPDKAIRVKDESPPAEPPPAPLPPPPKPKKTKREPQEKKPELFVGNRVFFYNKKRHMFKKR